MFHPSYFMIDMELHSVIKIQFGIGTQFDFFISQVEFGVMSVRRGMRESLYARTEQI